MSDWTRNFIDPLMSGVRWAFRLPTIPVAIAFTLLWVTFVMGVATLLVTVKPFADWPASNKLGLMAVAASLAGFGSTLVALLFAAVEIRAALPRSRLRLTLKSDSVEARSDGSRKVRFTVFVNNRGDGVPQLWQARLTFLSGVPDELPREGGVARLGWSKGEQGQFTFNAMNTPLFRDTAQAIGTLESLVPSASREIMIGYQFQTENRRASRHLSAMLRLDG